MSRIRHFLTPSSPEGAAADAVLQLVSHIHDRVPAEASRLLTELVGGPVELGIDIVRRPVADGQGAEGLVVQRAIRVIVEAKIDSSVSLEQMRRKAGLFRGKEEKFLLLLTPEPLIHQERMLAALFHDSHPDVVFRNLTYRGICRTLRHLSLDAVPALADLVRDFEVFCHEAGLLGPPDRSLWIVPGGRIREVCVKHGIWFQPSDRGFDPPGFIGICGGRKVNALLDVRAVFDVELIGDRLDKTTVRGEVTDRFDTSLSGLIQDVKSSLGLDVATGNRFYCGDVHSTDFRRSSAGELLEAILVDLGDVLGTFADAADAASKLCGKKWS